MPHLSFIPASGARPHATFLALFDSVSLNCPEFPRINSKELISTARDTEASSEQHHLSLDMKSVTS